MPKKGRLGQNVDKPVDGTSLVLGWVVVELGRLDAILRFFSLIVTSALLSADRSFFSVSESFASSSDSYSSTAVQPAGLFSAKRINLFRLVRSFHSFELRISCFLLRWT